MTADKNYHSNKKQEKKIKLITKYKKEMKLQSVSKKKKKNFYVPLLI
jgi:hypothetical protein